MDHPAAFLRATSRANLPSDASLGTSDVETVELRRPKMLSTNDTDMTQPAFRAAIMLIDLDFILQSICDKDPSRYHRRLLALANPNDVPILRNPFTDQLRQTERGVRAKIIEKISLRERNWLRKSVKRFAISTFMLSSFSDRIIAEDQPVDFDYDLTGFR